MSTAFDTFDKSPLDAFVKSPLDARNSPDKPLVIVFIDESTSIYVEPDDRNQGTPDWGIDRNRLLQLGNRQPIVIGHVMTFGARGEANFWEQIYPIYEASFVNSHIYAIRSIFRPPRSTELSSLAEAAKAMIEEENFEFDSIKVLIDSSGSMRRSDIEPTYSTWKDANFNGIAEGKSVEEIEMTSEAWIRESLSLIGS